MENSLRAFRLLYDSIPVGDVFTQLEAQPELWDGTVERKGPGSPHNEVSEIWLRYRDRRELLSAHDFRGPHIPVWWPAWRVLPALHNIVYDLAAHVRCVHLGGVFITRIPAGGEVSPHNDRGTWHPEYHNCKVYLPITTNDDCVNYCNGDSQVMRAGEAWTFDNLVTHSVVNGGSSDRMTLIVSMRVED